MLREWISVRDSSVVGGTNGSINQRMHVASPPHLSGARQRCVATYTSRYNINDTIVTSLLILSFTHIEPATHRNHDIHEALFPHRRRNSLLQRPHRSSRLTSLPRRPRSPGLHRTERAIRPRWQAIIRKMQSSRAKQIAKCKSHRLRPRQAGAGEAHATSKRR